MIVLRNFTPFEKHRLKFESVIALVHSPIGMQRLTTPE
jgi:hypothetical protein